MDIHTAALEAQVKQQLHNHPTARIQSVRCQGNSYFIKRCLSNGRNRFAKNSTVMSFLIEVYKMNNVNSRIPLAPRIVLWGMDYVVMEDCGQTLQHIAKADDWCSLRRHIFFKAGKSLALLHQAGLYHGRPALRDIAYRRQNDKITFLDWENEKMFVKASPAVLDLFLFIHSCFREAWPTTALIDEAVRGYLSVVGSTQIWNKLRAFIHRHAILFGLCHYVAAVFHWIDVSAADAARHYIESYT